LVLEEMFYELKLWKFDEFEKFQLSEMRKTCEDG
jgi:hypothetical protein